MSKRYSDILVISRSWGHFEFSVFVCLFFIHKLCAFNFGSHKFYCCLYCLSVFVIFVIDKSIHPSLSPEVGAHISELFLERRWWGKVAWGSSGNIGGHDDNHPFTKQNLGKCESSICFIVVSFVFFSLI